MKYMLCYGIIICGLVGWTACAHLPLPEGATEVRVLGKFGAGPGEFNEPFAIAIGKNDSIYVADARNHRIQMFNEAGDFKKQWGGQGDGPGQFERPAGIAVDREGNVYVSDFELDRIQKFDAEGEFILQWGKGGKGPGQFNSPTGLTINSQGQLFVADTYNHRIQKFDSKGNWSSSWGEYKPIGVMRSFFNLFVSPGAEGDFNYPVRVTIGAWDKVFVSDAYNNRVEVFSSDGNYLSQFGSIGFLGGSFRVSSGIAADKAGRIIVADFYNHRIQMFNEKGDHMGHWGQKGTEVGQFDGPTDIAVDTRGRIYIVDWGNHRVQIYK